MERAAKAAMSEETFDDFLASENLLTVCEEDAIAEIAIDQAASAEKSLDRMMEMVSGTVGQGDLGAR